jgi:hypothetical protein
MPHAERATKRQDTGRAAKRRSADRHPTTTGRRRPTLPSQAAPRARTAVAKRRNPGGFGPGNVRAPIVKMRKAPRRRR